MNPTAEIAAALVSVVRTRAQPPAWAWLETALHALDPGGTRDAFLTAYAAAGRRLGRNPVVPDAGEGARLAAAGLRPFPSGLGLDECGRGALVLVALEPLPEAERVELASELYYKGEVRERQAVLRVLAYLPSPASFLDLAVEACRTSALGVFEAIACENPYPAFHFPEASFNQMALKAVFNGLALRRIAGLAARVTPDLVRMAGDYAAERRAAGRTLPDLDLILAAGTRSA